MFNVEAYIGDCLGSLQSQTYKNIEIVVIDDCSTDKGKNVVFEKMQSDKRIRYYRTEINGGQSHARILGVTKASGEDVCFVDGDDVVGRNFIFMLLLARKDNPLAIAEIQYKLFADGKRTPLEKISKNTRFYSEGSFITRFLKESVCKKSNSIPVVTKMFPKQLIIQHPFETSSEAEDYLENAKLLVGKNDIFINKSIEYFYRQRKGSTTNREISKRSFEQISNAKKVMELLEKNNYPKNVIHLGRDRYLRSCFSIYLNALRRGHDSSVSDTRLSSLRNEIKKNYWHFLFGKNPLLVKLVCFFLVFFPGISKRFFAINN